MSVIAWDGKILAADSQCTNNGLITSCNKIWKLPSGEVLAIIGDYAHQAELKNWYLNGAPPDDWPSFQSNPDISIIVVARVEKVNGIPTPICEFYEQRPYPIRFPAPFMAWGAGRDIAIGMLYAGESATHAVAAACEFNIYCGGLIHSFAPTDSSSSSEPG